MATGYHGPTTGATIRGSSGLRAGLLLTPARLPMERSPFPRENLSWVIIQTHVHLCPEPARFLQPSSLSGTHQIVPDPVDVT